MQGLFGGADCAADRLFRQDIRLIREALQTIAKEVSSHSRQDGDSPQEPGEGKTEATAPPRQGEGEAGRGA